MRVRVPFAIAFIILSLLAAYLGFSKYHPPFFNDKFLHFTTFFILTVVFYWIIETSRRRVINITFFSITFSASLISEFAQPIINPSRPFDALDILFNVLGSALALVLMQWYHKRMLERRRTLKSTRYHAVATEDGGDPGDGDDDDLDLEMGVSGGGVSAGAGAGASAGAEEMRDLNDTRRRVEEEDEEGDIGGVGRR